MKFIVKYALREAIKRTGMGFRLPSGELLIAPENDAPVLHFKRWRDIYGLLIDPDLRFGEAFANGHIIVENGTIYDVVYRQSISYNARDIAYTISKVIRFFAQPILQFFEGITPKQSRNNVHAHYDLGNELYELFLDDDMQYSCAYFVNTDQDLATAQQQKKNHIIRKLSLKPYMSVLDIGCGWGGLSLDLARAGAKVTGLTLSDNQYNLAIKRRDETKLNVNFKLLDYRLEEGKYDRIVSVGMFEHVGRNQFGRFFKQVSRNLKNDGIALIHTIGRPDRPQAVNRFITKHIFPGGYIPSLSQIAREIEKTDLIITDVECLYIHYAETLKRWRENFMARRDEAVAMYDERFALIWELYLAGCEAYFRSKDMMVYQVQIKKIPSPVQLTRNYLYN